ncbi:hypothetical protein HBA55_16055 [Pseudomaricurvus alkylphenolicus]|jgi:DUF1680 family protein|uniref:hypothetical protein n=1 Tax=Pseudomaricurvus alkylphenolicus TaxID=1306991 RepID=UPI00141F05C2|nr:hypothetical protein [Pseudomaricurvus alkylphenolicus]NIB41119.1 hypothetical protein [Pseudomaricurvus alkylphenolicus]
MSSTSIAEAISTLTELLQTLEDAYWEASTIRDKDTFFDLISAINQEQTELAKLSIQDHHLDYEMISLDFRRCQNKLGNLRKRLDDCVTRSSTAVRLDTVIGQATALMGH